MSKDWDEESFWGSDIIGNGQAWGDMRGKVKTKQIGFIRSTQSPRRATRPNKVRSNQTKTVKTKV